MKKMLFRQVKRVKGFVLSISILLLIASFCRAQNSAVKVDWPSFMQRQTLKWDTISTDYYSGIILGNGLLGTNIYKESDSSLRFDVGRTDVVDNRSQLVSKASKLYNRARLPIGYFRIQLLGKITSADMQLDIYNATAKGTISTTKGTVAFTAYVSADQEVIDIKIEAGGEEQSPICEFVPGKSVSPRYQFDGPKDKPADFPENPAPTLHTIKGYSVCHQPLLNGGGYSTVYKNIPQKNGFELWASVGYDENNNSDENKEAINCLENFGKTTNTNFIQHQKWWNSFFQKSFISIPDKRMENFYWIQLYKMASATRPNKPMLDLMGPWTTATPWPAIWWNLNAQLSYSPVFTANHLELGQSLFNTLNKNVTNLIENVPEMWQYNSAAIGRSSSYDLISKISEKEIGNGTLEPVNLTWVLFYYYQYYAYSQDSATLVEKIYPLLKKSCNFILHLLKKDDSGVYHVPMSFSPEYKSAEDANYTLASLRWALETLISVNAKQHLKDKDAKEWATVLEKLVPYPVNDEGFMIGKDVALTSSHRHYSHLMMIYPYCLVNWDQPENRSVIKQSLAHWLSFKGALKGFSYSGGASMYALMGDGENSYLLLNDLFNKFIKPNTLYAETGPVIETPLAAANSIEDMLLQSWGNKIRIFPAVPASWKDAAFDNLRAEGAFLVSAKKEDGSTSFISINATKPGNCTLLTDMKGFVVTSNKRTDLKYVETQLEGKTQLAFTALENEIITLRAKGKSNFDINTVPYTQSVNWSWGLKKKSK